MPQLKREFFVAHPLDGPLLSLSLGYAAVRRFQSGAEVRAKSVSRRSESAHSGTKDAAEDDARSSVALKVELLLTAASRTFRLIPSGRMRSLCALAVGLQDLVLGTLVKSFQLVLPPQNVQGMPASGAMSGAPPLLELSEALEVKT